MKQGEKGFSTIELIVALFIIALIGSAAAATTFQVINGTARSNAHMTAVRQIQNAGYWISHDAQMAESVVTDNLTHPDFLVLTWTEQDYSEDDPIYHSVTYFFEDLSDGIGKLKRNHWSSAGANEYTLIAEYVYYDSGDPDNTSKTTYQKPVLTVQLTALFGDARECKEYRITRRPNLN